MLERERDRMTTKHKIVLIGAGSLQFGIGTVGNILASEILAGSTICLHDINASALDLTRTACQAAIDEGNHEHELDATIERQEALKGADFIINAIEVPPRFKLWNIDYMVPLQFGCKQVTGENGGPGGFFHALRVIPPILEICKDVRATCPGATVINFSNPMSRICLAIKRTFPSLKVVGLCHEFHHFVPQVGHVLDVPPAELALRGGGLNHFGVFVDIRRANDNVDLYPLVCQRGPEHFRSIRGYDGFTLAAFILEKFGYLPYTPDSHFGEYLQWAWEQADIPAIRQFISTYESVLAEDHAKLVRLIKKGKGARVVKPDEERAIPIIEAMISGITTIEHSVNIPNDGLIDNLPRDLVIEGPAEVGSDGIKGIPLGSLPKGIAALLVQQAAVQDLTVEAILTGSRDVAMQALLADPVVETHWQASRILDEVLRQQDRYLQVKLT